MGAFGPNEWLVDELYEQYLRDKNSVDRAWWEFFEDYKPLDGSGPRGRASTPSAPAAAMAPTTAPAAAKPVQSVPEAPSDPGSATAAPAPKTDTPAPKPAASPTPRDIPAVKSPPPASESQVRPLRGPAARVVTNMQASIEVPTATSVRTVPAKLLIDNRVVINNHLARSRGGKVSFTHIIGYALVKALGLMPAMNCAFSEVDGKPVVVEPAHVNLGLAIDLAKPDGTRQLLVPSIKSAETMDFVHFWTAYEEMVKKARNGKLTVEDFAGTTISLTNPGTIGTVHSVPRLMQGQGAIIGVGAMEYPAEWSGASIETLNRNAVSKTLTLTSTYDHRIIQGAQSGDFLRIVHQLLLGAEGFYDEIFAALRIPYEPVRWVQDISTTHDDDINKVARVQELIHAYRVRGHLMADTDPLEYRQRRHPD
ncbi:MAG TPA: 2-oxo acid dehydrogenase subunit E2, partial [Dermatophilaceae bacterium]|nr:2-oxo acid dehydrogenase subunit E2 [Dermatophilaceae bacterium]